MLSKRNERARTRRVIENMRLTQPRGSRARRLQTPLTVRVAARAPTLKLQCHAIVKLRGDGGVNAMRAGNVPAQLVMARACRPSKKILTPLELAAGWEADRIFMDRPDKPGDDIWVGALRACYGAK